MSPSNNCWNLIKEQEDCVLHPYLDQAGIPTIGWGSITYGNGAHVTMADPPINQMLADELLKDEVLAKSSGVDAMIAGLGLNQNQFDSLVSFAYNVGVPGLRGSTLLKRIRANKNDPTIRDAFAMWNKIHVDGKLVSSKGLTRRRQTEANLYFS